jgi:hypothetical protein
MRVAASSGNAIFGRVSRHERRKEPDMVEIPKATLLERIRSRSGPEAADSANDELPDTLDLDSDTDARNLVGDRHPQARRRVMARGTSARRLGSTAATPRYRSLSTKKLRLPMWSYSGDLIPSPSTR